MCGLGIFREMKGFCIFLLSFGVTNALFTERFQWPLNETVDNRKHIANFLEMRPWKDKLFFSTGGYSYVSTNVFSGIVYVDLNTTEKSPPLRPYPKDEADLIKSATTLEMDECGRLWTYDYLNETIVIIDLKQSKIIRQVKLNGTDSLMDVTSYENHFIHTRILTVDVNSSDCSNAYAYIPKWEGLNILVYSFKHNKYWETGEPDFAYEPHKLRLTDIRNFGIYINSTSSSPPPEKDNRMLILRAGTSNYFIAASTKALQNSENQGSFQFSKAFDNLATWKEDPWFNEKNSIMFVPVYGLHLNQKNLIVSQDVTIGCWNVKRYLQTSPNTRLLEKLPAAEQKVVTISDLKTDDQDIMWALVKVCENKDCYNFMYTTHIKDMVKGTVCDSV